MAKLFTSKPSCRLNAFYGLSFFAVTVSEKLCYFVWVLIKKYPLLFRLQYSVPPYNVQIKGVTKTKGNDQRPLTRGLSQDTISKHYLKIPVILSFWAEY
jgi:hypothetical protein